MRFLERQRNIENFMAGIPSFKKWKVDKQMIAVEPDGSVAPRRGDVMSQALVKVGAYEIIDFTWPRVIRVTITNGMQVALIDDVHMGDESKLIEVSAVAENQCAFLNAHEVR
jgi:hypothetical protein